MKGLFVEALMMGAGVATGVILVGLVAFSVLRLLGRL